ncbi:hypothetical protein AB0M48_36620 [Lentzea sp. NPDC051208]|uniref:hypothetical protein n=1 Tax=Lentzea sp. NPDC051208 TaxID=3154642 RepID=UPI00341D98C1
MPSNRVARSSGAPRCTREAAHSSSATTTRRIVRPVSSVSITATSSRSCASGAVSGGAGLADAMYETVMRSILDEPPATETTSTATDAVRRRLPELRQLTEAERTLLSEWLARP